MQRLFCFLACACTYRVVLEEQLAPLILDVEEEAEDEDDVGEGDEADHHEATVHGHPPPLLTNHQREAKSGHSPWVSHLHLKQNKVEWVAQW